MEPSDFQKLMQEFHLSDGSQIELKKSSYKKIGKLMESMSDAKGGEGYISFTLDAVKKHKIITAVYKEWQ